MCHGQRTTLWGWFSPSTVMWDPAIKFRSQELYSKLLSEQHCQPHDKNFYGWFCVLFYFKKNETPSQTKQTLIFSYSVSVCENRWTCMWYCTTLLSRIVWKHHNRMIGLLLKVVFRVIAKRICVLQSWEWYDNVIYSRIFV